MKLKEKCIVKKCRSEAKFHENRKQNDKHPIPYCEAHLIQMLNGK